MENSELFRSREMIVEQDHPKAGKLKMVANAIKVRGDSFTVPRPAPDVGEHTDEILIEIGYPQQKIADLRERRII